MSLDDLDQTIRTVQDQPVPWDDLRERRVLAEFRRRRETADDPAVRTAPARSGRTTVLLASGMMTTAAAVILAVLGASGSFSGPSDLTDTVVSSAPDIPLAPAPSVAEVSPEDSRVEPVFASRMELSDGSVVSLAAGAAVSVERQEKDIIRLAQAEGLAHYDVVPGLVRRFEIVAAGVEVEVVGTAFDIELSATQFEVRVDRGKVEVTAGDRVAELGAGDQLQVQLPLAALDLASESDEAEASGTTQAAPREPRPAQIPTMSVMLEHVDAARASGDQAQAAKLLRELLAAHPKDPRAASAWFTLGRVEKSRGRLVQAARGFERAHDKAPRGPLAEDALAESAKAWQRAGDTTQAARVAARYLNRYAQGTHRARMANIASE